MIKAFLVSELMKLLLNDKRFKIKMFISNIEEIRDKKKFIIQVFQIL